MATSMPRDSDTDFGNLFLSTGGVIVGGAAICLFAGTIGVGGFLAACGASYVVLKFCNALERSEKRRR